VEPITIEITPSPSLSRVVRVAVTWHGRARGLKASQATEFGRLVTRRFRDLLLLPDGQKGLPKPIRLHLRQDSKGRLSAVLEGRPARGPVVVRAGAARPGAGRARPSAGKQAECDSPPRRPKRR